MNYIDKIAKAIGSKCNMTIGDREERRLLRGYALLALTRGDDTTLENVHDAWAVWRIETVPDHRSLIPFDDLSKEVQEMDREYCNAILEVVDEMEGYQ